MRRTMLGDNRQSIKNPNTHPEVLMGVRCRGRRERKEKERTSRHANRTGEESINQSKCTVGKKLQSLFREQTIILIDRVYKWPRSLLFVIAGIGALVIIMI